ncbi:FG-GAP repeat domain-containing protein [Streptomyces sp. NPDC048566]|uniref:FG-GAP repeat domain-containing protein n=1 Tax=Streptomyces sp. NPDC048566 TaxID=3365569 RepID=UPI003713B377
MDAVGARWAGPLALGLLALVAPTGAGPSGATTVPVTPAFVPVPAASPVRDDFDGDGHPDLAIADSRATVGGRRGAGRVTVLYGGPGGDPSTAPARRAVVSRATAGVPGAPAAGEGFGTAISRGDLDADGYADLVVGTAGRGGAVILRGGPHGLSGAVPLPAATARAGDFDGDGLLDLALFRPGRGVAAGTVAAIWTGPVGRGGEPARVSALDPGGLARVRVAGGASGDLDGDGRDDLALVVRAGAGPYRVHVYRSTTAGPVRTADHRGGPGLAVGDLDGDGYADLVAGSGRRAEIAHGSAAGVGPGSGWTTVRLGGAPVPSGRSGAGPDVTGPGVRLLDTDGDGCADLAAVPGGPAARHGGLRRLSGCRAGAVRTVAGGG